MKDYVELLRPHHYIKNILVFAALVCGGQLFVVEKLISAVIGFVAFCAASSAVYIFNDICDCEKDRLHPTKKNRPIASGRISIKKAYGLCILMVVVSLLAESQVYSPTSLILLCIYLVLNFAYSLGLKNYPIIDIVILTSGFLIRVLYGAVITDIVLSEWLFLTVTTVSLCMVLGKRRNEIKRIPNGETRKVLKAYSVQFLDKAMYMCLGMTNVFYALWAIDKRDTLKNGAMLIWTVPFVLVMSLTYCMIVDGDSDGDPIEVLVHNKILLVLGIVYAISMIALLYV